MCILTDKSEKPFCNIYKQIINNNCATSKNCIVYMYIDLLISIYIYIYIYNVVFNFLNSIENIQKPATINEIE